MRNDTQGMTAEEMLVDWAASLEIGKPPFTLLWRANCGPLLWPYERTLQRDNFPVPAMITP